MSVRVDLGTTDHMPGRFNIGIDIAPNHVLPEDQFMQADLRDKWPFEDNAVDEFRAHDIIEHLPDHVFTMNEMWRCLKHGATVEVVVPLFPGSGAVQDPTHVSMWVRRSFLYYKKGCDYRDRFAANYGIMACFEIVSEHVEDTIDGPKLTIVLRKEEE